jgi:hypothetical protein
MAAQGKCPDSSVIRAAMLAGSAADALPTLLAEEHDLRSPLPPGRVDRFFQATRLFELLDRVVPGWGGPLLGYRPEADAAWREDQCRRLGLWYQLHWDRLPRRGEAWK